MSRKNKSDVFDFGALDLCNESPNTTTELTLLITDVQGRSAVRARLV